MSRVVDDFRRSYVFAFRRYVDNPTETLLRAAYELGREAVAGRLSVLELAEAHHDAMLRVLRDRAEIEPEHVVASARDFLLESLSSFEMMERAAAEVRHAARAERRQAEMVRRLSGLLADASVAESHRSLHEVLQLVAEQALEVLAADSCTIRLSSDGTPLAVECAADNAWNAHDWSERSSRPARGPMRAVTEEPNHTRSRISAPLASLRGVDLGQIDVQRDGTAFTQLDEALLVHLAQMTSAAVERATLVDRTVPPERSPRGREPT